MRLWFALFFAIVSCARQPITPAARPPGGQPVEHVRAGTWGGEHAALTVTAGGATMEFDCASGEILTPVAIDAEGRFDVRGVFVAGHGGPIRAGDQANRNPARYRGRIRGTSLTLTVTLLESNDDLGTFSLMWGVEPRLRKCL